MTRSKLEFATILASLRGANEDPQKLAQEMTLRKLCYEIEKAEETREAATTQAPDSPPETPEVEEKIRPLWSIISLEEE
jgi:hypothetical protein